MKLWVLAVLAIVLIGSVATGSVVLNNYYKEHAPTSCREAIQVGYVWLPEKVSDLFMNDRLVLHFSMVNGENITVYGTVQDHGVYDLKCSSSDVQPDADIWMSDETAIQLAISTSPISTFVTNWRNGNIVIETHNDETKEKLGKADELAAMDYEPVPVTIRLMFGMFLGQSQ